MLSLGIAAPSVLLLAILIDVLLAPARRVVPGLERWAVLPGEDSAWLRARPVRQRRLAGGIFLGAVMVLGLILLFRFQYWVQYRLFVFGFPFGDLVIGALAAGFISVRTPVQMLARVRVGLAQGRIDIARDGLGMVLPWRAVAQTPQAVARQAVEAGVVGLTVDFLAPALAFLILGLPGPVLWRVLIALGSLNPAAPGRDRQVTRIADRALLLLLFGPGWLVARGIALAGLLVRVPFADTRAHLERRLRHAEQPLAPAMDAMAAVLGCTLGRPVRTRPGGEAGIRLNPDAPPVSAATLGPAVTVVRGVIGLMLLVPAALAVIGWLLFG